MKYKIMALLIILILAYNITILFMLGYATIGTIYRYFVYFTIQTNIFVLLVLIFIKSKRVEKFIIPVTTLITVTMVVFWVAIQPFIYTYQTPPEVVANALTHALVPVMMLYVFKENRARARCKSNFIIVNTYAFVYGIVTVSLMLLTGFVPYVFFDYPKYGAKPVAFIGAMLILTINLSCAMYEKVCKKTI